jgi:hypothetical protein
MPDPGDGRGQKLERDLPAQALVEGPVNDCHPANAEPFFDPVAGQPGTNSWKSVIRMGIGRCGRPGQLVLVGCHCGHWIAHNPSPDRIAPRRRHFERLRALSAPWQCNGQKYMPY